MTSVSPFSQNRFEYESQHLYYLSEKLLKELEAPKPMLLIGSRGSGKTTLLKALSWEEQVHNRSLQRQLKSHTLDRGYIGTYVKLPTIQLDTFSRWLGDKPDLYGQLFAYYLELFCGEMMSRALASVCAAGIFRVSPDDEARTIAGCAPDIFETNSHAVNSLYSLFEALRAARKQLERDAQLKAEPATVLQRHKLIGIGELIKRVAKALSDVCDPATGESRWHFKVCMDEGEVLDAFQQRVVRTLIRLAEWPFFPVISFVRTPEDRTTTLLSGLTLQATDRGEVILDDQTLPEFRTMAEGVATVRVREALADDCGRVDVESLLGKLDINRILDDIISKSERREAHDLRAFADELASGGQPPIGTAKRGGKPGPVQAPPIYQAYLVRRLNLTFAQAQSRREKRRIESSSIRKKMVAAYLAICNELGTHVRYASADMVLGISDNCIRDFLSQLDALFEATGNTLADFVGNTIPYKTQYAAIHTASENKKASLPASGVSAPVETGRLVDGLGALTADIQGIDARSSTLNSPERGCFVVDVTAAQKHEHAELFALIDDAAEAGFLRVDHRAEQVRFRMHRSLAPAYGFSYRGPYYPVRLHIQEVDDLRRLSNADARRVVDAIGKRLANEPEQPLFEELK